MRWLAVTPGFELLFPIFITTLGPLKTIPVFHSLTRNAPFRYRAELALRSTLEASLVAGFVVLVASRTMEDLQISHDAMAIAGGLILFVTALRAIMGFSLAALPPEAPEDEERLPLTWMDRPTLSPLAVPTIVTMPMAIESTNETFMTDHGSTRATRSRALRTFAWLGEAPGAPWGRWFWPELPKAAPTFAKDRPAPLRARVMVSAAVPMPLEERESSGPWGSCEPGPWGGWPAAP